MPSISIETTYNLGMGPRLPDQEPHPYMFYLLGTNSCALANKSSTSYVHNMQLLRQSQSLVRIPFDRPPGGVILRRPPVDLPKVATGMFDSEVRDPGRAIIP